MRKLECPEVIDVMSGLKDFQQATVEYVFNRMYLDPEPSRQFLIADEVGLGKTMVARGLIAKAIEHLDRQGVERIDVVYICSNAEIARQNIARLNVLGCRHFELATRITLLPRILKDLQCNRVNFVSFTPSTSFDIRSGLGVYEERALLYTLLDRAWHIPGTGPLNVFQGKMGKDRFRDYVRDNLHNGSIDATLADAFVRKANQHPELRERYQDLCTRFSYARKHIPQKDRDDRARFVGDMRRMMAKACVEALEPDLIILDEFQRFKHLLDPQDEAGLLARELFDYKDARVILLSATPYKMYTLTDENEDDHYKDFLNTLRFLQGDPAKTEKFAELLTDYRHELFRMDQGIDRVRALKIEIEQALRQVMVRTERLAVSADRDGMLTEVPQSNMVLHVDDIIAYGHQQRLAKALSIPDIMEYWKSAPYILSFMEEYALKRAFKAARQTGFDADITAILKNATGMTIPWKDIKDYAEVDPGNARLRNLIADTIGMNAWQLLWIPPSLPYYQLRGAYADNSCTRFTKRLIFSSWLMVPKVISTMVSYEAERQILMMRRDAPPSYPEMRKKHARLLVFQRSDGRLSGMPVLGMIYPCTVLAREGDALMLAHGEILPIDDIIRIVASRLEELLAPIVAKYATVEKERDEAWYWAAPILLDKYEDREVTDEWWLRDGLAMIWSGQIEIEDGEESRWIDHVAEAKELISDTVSPSSFGLGQPPQDLYDVLARIAIAGPGTTSLRALARVTDGLPSTEMHSIRDAAARIAYATLSLFNQPEATALIRGLYPGMPYWRGVLSYCIDGGFQSVLDEYAHMLRESLGLMGHLNDETSDKVATAMKDALSLRTSSMGIDEIGVTEDGQIDESHAQSMRGRFALPFGESRTADDEGIGRVTKVREAFNSPFWPFVLATTSVGQEGLDFHPYCHAVIHWNLPSNPVDLEQREGRVHRYKGHAVRKNVAKKLGLPAYSSNVPDPWNALFDKAKAQRSSEANDLVPYWIYPIENGATIERHVPAMPLSRDQSRLTALRRSLVVYRMVFGQPRQEDLVAYLLDRLPQQEINRIVDELRIDLGPIFYK